MGIFFTVISEFWTPVYSLTCKQLQHISLRVQHSDLGVISILYNGLNVVLTNQYPKLPFDL